MRLDVEAWADRVAKVLDLGDRAELTISLIVAAGLVTAGVGALLGFSLPLAGLTGAAVAAVLLTVAWWRARGRGEGLWDDVP